MTRVLIVYHTQSGNTRLAAEAVAAGVEESGGAQALLKRAQDATLEDLLAADALAVGTPDYFSYMAGAVKDFFDRVYYPAMGKTEGKPVGIFVTHGGGGKAVSSVESMCRRFTFEPVAEAVSVIKRPSAEAVEQLRELGRRLAAVGGE